MPKKIVRQTETVFDAAEDTTPKIDKDDEVPEHNLEDMEGLRQYLGQFGPTPFKIKVYKSSPRGPQYCFSGSTEVDEDSLKEFGGGDYELRVFVNGTRRDTLMVKIAEPPRSQFNNGPSDATAIELRLMRENMQFMKEMLLGKAVQGGIQSSTPLAELVDAVKAVNGLGGGMNSPMDVFLKGVEFAKEIGGGHSDWKTALIDSVRDIAKGIAPAMMASRTPQPVATGEQVVTQNPDQVIYTGIQYLKQKAMSGLPAELVIDWVLANANDPQYQPFLKVILTTEFDEFSKIDPEINQEPYVTYFKNLHAGLRQAFNENQSNDDSDGTTRNAGNLKSNGGTGKASRAS